MAFALGAIVSPPDAVAVTSILGRMKLPRRIITILEGDPIVRLHGGALGGDRRELIKLWRNQEIGDEVLHHLERELDLEEARLRH